MKMVIRLAALAATLALGVWLWTVIFPSPEKIIRHRLTEVARAASFAPQEGMLARTVNAQKLASYFALQAEVSLDLPGGDQHELAGRDEITQAAFAARNYFRALQVDFLDAQVMLMPDHQSAMVDLTVKAKVPDEKDYLVQEMKITFRKLEDIWLITRVESVKTLK